MKNFPDNFIKCAVLCTAVMLQSCTAVHIELGNPVGKSDVVGSLGNVKIVDIEEDSQGNIWFGTESDGVVQYNGASYIHYKATHGDYSLSSNNILDMFVDSKGVLWVATQRSVNRYDCSLKSFVGSYRNDYNGYVVSILEDHKGNLYFLTFGYLLKYNGEGDYLDLILSLPFNENAVRPTALFDADDGLWLSTDKQIFHYDSQFLLLDKYVIPTAFDHITNDGEGMFAIYDEDRMSYFDISTRTLTSPVVDSQTARNRGLVTFFDSYGNIWNTLPQGGVRVTHDDSAIISDKDFASYIRNHKITSVAGDGRYYWAVLDDESLLTYDVKTHSVQNVQLLEEDLRCSLKNPVLRWGDGMLVITESPTPKPSFTLLSLNPNGVPSYRSTIYARGRITAEAGSDGSLWCLDSDRSLYLLDKGLSGRHSLDEFAPAFILDAPNQVFPNIIRRLSSGDIVVLQTDNLPIVIDAGTGEITNIPLNNSKRWQVFYSSFLEDSRGGIWIGTKDRGLFRYDRMSDVVENVRQMEWGATTDIVEDSSGNIFFVYANDKVYSFDYGTDSFRLLYQNQASLSPGFSLALLPNGQVIMDAGDRRLNLSEELRTSKEPVRQSFLNVTLTSQDDVLYRFSTAEQSSGTIHFKLDKSVNDLNMILFLQDYASDNQYDFRYRVNGGGAYQSSMYSQTIPLYGLKYGTNKVSFYAQDSFGNRRSDEFTIYFHLRIPWFFFLSAAIFLFVLVIGVILYYIAGQKRREAETERRERVFQQEVNMKNVDFFANISHEFRSPLTLVNGAALSMAAGGSHTDEDERSIAIILRNTKRMLKLVSQLLDFNKLEHDMLELSVRLEDISLVVGQVMGSFAVSADQKGIVLSSEGLGEPNLCWFDADKVEKILYNLYSNAIKYTPSGGFVNLCAKMNDGARFVVSVEDSGIGIPEDKTEHIFDRFYQTDSAHKSGGTGIGLYYVKSLVELHKGSVIAENVHDGDGRVSGARFTFCIPVDRESYSEEETAVGDAQGVPVPAVGAADKYVEYVNESCIGQSGDKEKTLLLIDDDYEMINFLQSILKDTYNIIVRYDALNGYKAIEENRPDLVVSDVMMMDVDGFQLCRMIKENINICHIPVIMLSALVSEKNQIESLQVGAEAFVPKPFSPDYLKAIIKTLLENRMRMSRILNTSTASPDEMNVRDREFMDKLYALMEESVVDGDIDITSFAEQLGISRTTFFHKVKALTNQTPNDFFNIYRLNYAARLLKEGKYKISAIANMVGFNSASYFSALFKKQFGVLPREYVND